MNDEEIFERAASLPEGSRTAYLDMACRGDSIMRARIAQRLGSSGESRVETRPPPEVMSAEIEAELARLKPEETGERIGRYKLLQEIGEGGFGSVWMAEQVDPVKRRVALKIIKLGMDTKEVIARFEQERQALAMMDHPNIAKVLDAGATPTGRPFFVMELVRGIKLTDYCDQAKLPTADRLQLFIAVCHAVQHAHQKGIIHRDLKPSNILVTLHDGVPVPKVIDFGVAKAMQPQSLTERTLFTQFEQMVGTPLYMSPEQAEMSGMDIDTRSDIYSLGVLLYELLTGRTPFDPNELMQQAHDEMRRAIREEEPPKPSTFVSTLAAEVRTKVAQHRQSDSAKLIAQIRGDLDWIVMKALEKDRTRRYETANGLAMDIQRHLADEPVLARPPSQVYRFKRLVRRNKLTFAAAAAVAVALIAGLSISIVSFRREQRQHQIADTEKRIADEQRQTAEEQRQIAKSNAARAQLNEAHARRLLYVADMGLAQQSLEANLLGRARRLLDRHRPEPGQEDLRGWEWRWLWQQCHGDAVVLTQRPQRAMTTSFSPDGRRLAVGYFDGRVEIWDIASRTMEAVLQEAGPIAQVAFSPATDALAFSGEPGVVKWHDFAANQEHTLCDAPGQIRDLSFSTDGTRLVVLTRRVGRETTERNKEAALVLAAGTGELLSAFDLPPAGGAFFNHARLSPDHQRLYITSGAFRQPVLRCIRLADGHTLWEADEREGISGRKFTGFTAMDLSADGKILATASGYSNNTIQIWTAETGQRLGALQGHTKYVMHLAFSRDGRTLASSSSDETVRLWDTVSWIEAAAPLRGNTDELHSVTFSPDGQLLATGSKDGSVMLWDRKTRKPPRGRQMLPANIRLAHLLPGGRTAFVTDTKLNHSLIDLATLRQTPLPLSAARSAMFAPPNFLGMHDGTSIFQLYELGDAGVKLLGELPVGPRFGSAFAFCPRTRAIAWTQGGGTIHLTNIDDPRNQTDLTTEDQGLMPARFDLEGRFLLATGARSAPRIWEVASQRRLPAAESYFSPFGSRVFGAYFPNALSGGGLLEWISVATGAAVGSRDLPDTPVPAGFWPQGSFSDRAYSPDGKTFAITTESGLVGLFDASHRKKLATLQGRQHAVFGVVFSPDGTRLAVANDALWDVATRQELLTFDAQGSLHHIAEFSDDGNTLLVGSPEQPGLCQFWRAPSWKEIEEAERHGRGWQRTDE